MTAPRSTDQLIKAYLDEGPTELADRAFDVIRGEIQRTRQRVVLGPWKEPNVTTITRLAIAAAVVVAVGFAWLNFGPKGGNFGGVPTPAPTITQAPGASVRVVPANNALPPGRYEFPWRLAAATDFEPGPSVFITIPSSGWTSFDQFAADKNYGPSGSVAGPSFVLWKITNRYTDACAHDVVVSPAPGPGVDELLGSLASQPGVTAGPLAPVTVDGYSGKYVELTVATDIATCAEGFFPWIDKFVQGNNEVLRVYALDVDGFRLTFFLRIPEQTTPADKADLIGIVDSIDIQP